MAVVDDKEDDNCKVRQHHPSPRNNQPMVISKDKDLSEVDNNGGSASGGGQ